MCGADMNQPDVHMVSMVGIIERFAPEGGSTRVHNLGLIETPPNGPSTTTALSGRRELIDVVEDRFEVPAEVVRTAIEGVDLTADIYN